VLSATTLIRRSIDCGGMCVGSEENDMRVVLMIALLVALAIGRVDEASAASCESLASLSLPDTTITMAQIGRARRLRRAGGARWACNGSVCETAVVLPHRRDVEADDDSTSRSKSGCRPTVGKASSRRSGNGGWAGTISYPAWRSASARYATTSTDTGHVAFGIVAALGHPEKFIDFAYRSEHEMTVKAKRSSAPSMAAVRSTRLERLLAVDVRDLRRRSGFPRTSTASSRRAGESAHSSGRLAPRHRPAALKDRGVHSPASIRDPPAVLDACDAIDGVKDGLINDLRAVISIEGPTCKGPGVSRT